MNRSLLTLAERVKRMRAMHDMSQRDLAAAAGLGPSTVAQIEQGIRVELRPSTIDKLATALAVHRAYFTTDDPKDFMRILFTRMSLGDMQLWQEMRPNQRWEWVINEMWFHWGDEWTAQSVAEKLGISSESFEKMLSGEWEIPPVMHEELAAITGVPVASVLASDEEIVDQVLLSYKKAVTAAVKAGLSPERLEQAIAFLSTMKQE